MSVNQDALFKISYGLYIVTCKSEEKDNGIIVNTVTQVTNTPNRIAVIINRESLSHEIIKNTKVMNINCLTEQTPFSVIENFGFKSGRISDKFENTAYTRSKNGITVLEKFTNAFISLEVENYIDIDTHGMFICKITESEIISDEKSLTYTYYQDNIKPKVKTQKGFVCKICGYVYEGDTLPEDYICPLCKHPASDFEKLNWIF